jgi:hypothetical protein
MLSIFPLPIKTHTWMGRWRRRMEGKRKVQVIHSLSKRLEYSFVGFFSIEGDFGLEDKKPTFVSL